MLSKDYDDLLESFMNNSAKVYNEDKKNQSTEEKNVPSAYNIDSSSSKDSKSVERGRVIEKKKRKSEKKKEKGGMSAGFRFFRFIAGVALIVGVVGIVCVSVMLLYAVSFVNGEAVFDLNEKKDSLSRTSFIYAYEEDGSLKELTRLHSEENREWIDLEDMGEYLPNAFIAIEDKRFNEHHGVDWIRTIGVVANPRNLGQGGSTITQQLIKNLTDEKQVTLARKFNEILSALNLERYNKKEDILETYLNTIFLSSGCYGVKTAAEKYFGKDVDKLNIAECACLAAITKSPTQYNPFLHPEENKKRQHDVLYYMHDQGMITDEEYEEAKAYEMVFTNSPNYQGSQVTGGSTETRTNVVDSWYLDYVMKTVMQDLQKEYGYNSRKARNMLYDGGLKIYAAVDLDVQAAIEDVYENYRKMPDETVQGAMVIMNYEGRVLGLVGGTGKKDNALGFNRATEAERPPGSTMKPIAVYGPAIEKSLKDDDFDFYWSTIDKDAPCLTINGKPWPYNEGHTYSSAMKTIQWGLAQSKNTISARTLVKIGIDYSFEYLRDKFHITTLNEVKDRDWSPLAVGGTTTGLKPIEMAAAYATFGNGGQYYFPYCYYKVEDSQGNVILENHPEETKTEALSEGSAWVMNKLLQTVMTSGTGRYYKISGVECFGKTGTTTNSYDRWFMGGTPEYIGAVWYGYDKNKEINYRLSYNPAGTLWNQVMTRVYKAKGKNVKTFPKYDGIVRKAYDPENGLLAKYASGAYGWYDKNNLPAYSKNTGTTAPETTTNVAENTTAATGGGTTTATPPATTKPAATQPAATQPATSAPAANNNNGNGNG
ncbi:MAG: transglycosylase domain-containing protein [Eubacterium sp.]|nr:transglycosylase domain-containing protein [Eubacterium sp.]